MQTRNGLLILMIAGLLAGCAAPTATAESELEEALRTPVREDAGVVTAEASIVPARWSELRIANGGEVIEVLVSEGDMVGEDDLLARFDPTDAELAVQAAEARLALAEVQLAQVKAGVRTERIDVIEAQLIVAQTMISRTLAQQWLLTAGAMDVQIATAQSSVASAQAQQRQALNLHDRTLECFDVNLPDGSERTICPALGQPEEQSRFAMHAADAALVAAQAQLDAAQYGATTQLRVAQAGVQSASAQRDALQARLELLKAGSTPEQIAAVEARVAQAEASLAAAQAALGRTEIRAPFDGVVTQVTIQAGDTAVPGQVIVVLAALDRLQARTTDLMELDVARVAEGQTVLVTVDALPELKLRGYVARIEEQGVDYRGDVTYPVFVELDEETSGLRWGMTAMVEIQVE
ncbi:MAG: HlyD family efflux transporter periplasmic adaptor subunit [Chloroflexi bacterium]|nr:HlyD family efflux transporter periplasmic adaptor subunit [Chloroflexota bacterium]